MAAFRALLFAVLGGFIGAAPAAPVAPRGGCADAGTNSQKREQSGYEVAPSSAAACAAAPPCTDAPPSPGAIAPPAAPRPFARVEAPVCAGRGPATAPPIEDVRAGLLGLPPPAR